MTPDDYREAIKEIAAWLEPIRSHETNSTPYKRIIEARRIADRALASTTAALPPPENGSGLGSDFYLVSDPEHSGPREDWYCGCPILKSPLTDLCPACRVAAPWLTWARSSASATKPEASPSPEKQELGDEQGSSCGGNS